MTSGTFFKWLSTLSGPQSQKVGVHVQSQGLRQGLLSSGHILSPVWSGACSTWFDMEMGGSQMVGEESEPGSVFTSENGRWRFECLIEWWERPLVEGWKNHPVYSTGHCASFQSHHVPLNDAYLLHIFSQVILSFCCLFSKHSVLSERE